MNFTKEQAITLMLRGAKVTHKYFFSDEWIRMEDGMIYDEKANVLEPNQFWNYRTAIWFNEDWSIFNPPQVSMIQVLAILGIKDLNQLLLDEFCKESDLADLFTMATEDDIMTYTDPEIGSYYAWKLRLHGLIEENFPWGELNEMNQRFKKSLSENLIISIS